MPIMAGISSEWERMTVQSVSADGLTVYLAAPVKYDHLGARELSGALRYLPQVVNDSRNIMVASQMVASQNFRERAAIRSSPIGTMSISSTPALASLAARSTLRRAPPTSATVSP
jgi:hypothetical protein